MPDVTHASGLFWATAMGAAFGVVAGTVIQYLLILLAQKDSRRRQKHGLAKEMAYNRSLVDELLAAVTAFRNAVNGRVFQTYFGYFHSGKGIFAQANASASNGLLYVCAGDVVQWGDNTPQERPDRQSGSIRLWRGCPIRKFSRRAIPR